VLHTPPPPPPPPPPPHHIPHNPLTTNPPTGYPSGCFGRAELFTVTAVDIPVEEALDKL